MADDTASFRATFPPILSAIRMAGDGGMRVMFDIPESDLGEATKLLLWRGSVMQVTIEPEQRESWTELDGEAKKGAEGSTDSVDSRRRAIRRDQ